MRVFVCVDNLLFLSSALQGVRREHGHESQANSKSVLGRGSGWLDTAAAHLEEQRRRPPGGVRHAGNGVVGLLCTYALLCCGAVMLWCRDVLVLWCRRGRLSFLSHI